MKPKYKVVNIGVLGIYCKFKLYKRFWIFWLPIYNKKRRQYIADNFLKLKEDGLLSVEFKQWMLWNKSKE